MFLEALDILSSRSRHHLSIRRRHIGSLPVSALKAADLLSVLRRLESHGKIETTHRVRSFCSRVLHMKRRAHQAHSEAASVVPDGSIFHLWSFAKNAAARFKKSRSAVTRASSRRNRVSSSCSALTSPRVLPAVWASSSSRTHRCSMLALTPSSRAICAAASLIL